MNAPLWFVVAMLWALVLLMPTNKDVQLVKIVSEKPTALHTAHCDEYHPNKPHPTEGEIVNVKGME